MNRPFRDDGGGMATEVVKHQFFVDHILELIPEDKRDEGLNRINALVYMYRMPQEMIQSVPMPDHGTPALDSRSSEVKVRYYDAPPPAPRTRLSEFTDLMILGIVVVIMVGFVWLLWMLGLEIYRWLWGL